MTVLLQDQMIVQKKKKITVTIIINHVLQRKEKLYHFKLLHDLQKSYHFSLYFAERVYKNI